MKRMKVFCLISLLPLSALFLNGCYTVPLALAGAGLLGVDTYLAKERDDIITPCQVFEYDFQTVCQASREVMNDFGIENVKEETIRQKRGLVATIKGSTQRYKNVTLSIVSLSRKATRVKVRVRDDMILYRPVTREDRGLRLEMAILTKLVVKLATKTTVAQTEQREVVAEAAPQGESTMPSAKFIEVPH